MRSLQEIYTIGTYCTLHIMPRILDIEEVLLLGRVTSGLGGQIIVDVSKNIKRKEHFK